MLATMEGQQNPSNAILQIQEILDAQHKTLYDRKKVLDEQEEAFQKKVRLFEESYPQSGKETDVLHLNIGGSTYVAVLRRVLTQFEDSMLASMFSGRWDDSLPKDKDGNFFLDHDPEVFMCLLKYLRMLDQKRGSNVYVPIPGDSCEVGGLLEYYGLTLSIYPHGWEIDEDGGDAIVTKPPSTNKPVILESKGTTSGFILELGTDTAQKPDGCSSLTITFKAGTSGKAEWIVNQDLVGSRSLYSPTPKPSIIENVESTRPNDQNAMLVRICKQAVHLHVAG